jgi:hypothetical protein
MINELSQIDPSFLLEFSRELVAQGQNKAT